MEAAHDPGRQSSPPPPADTAAGQGRHEVAFVAGFVFLGAEVAISTLLFGVWTAIAMVWDAMQENDAGPSWSALILVAMVPFLGLIATGIVYSGALAVGAVLAATTAALLRQVPFWVLLAMAGPCVLTTRIQFAWMVDRNHWGDPSLPVGPSLAVLLPLFASWLLLRRVLRPRPNPTAKPAPRRDR